MADRYWVAGSSNWDGVNGWKFAYTTGGTGAGSPPTSSDDVYFDANSGSGVVTIDSGQTCRSLNFSGFTGTINFSNVLGVYGSITLGTTATITGLLIALNGSGTGNTITPNGKTIPYLDVNGAGGDWTFQSAATITELRLRNGTLTLKSGATTTVGSVTNSTSSGTKALNASTPGSTATISDSSGTNSFNYVTITDITAEGGAAWVPGNNSTNGGGNFGWSGWGAMDPLLLGDF
jgi:hypothetical protein